MNKLMQLGTELAMLIRRRDAATAELTAVNQRIDVLCQEISDAPSGTLYGSNTGEQPTVNVDPDGSHWEPVTLAPKPRNQAPVPMSRPEPRPLRDDRQDGGNTFQLTPIADTVTLPAVHPCPRTSGAGADACGVFEAHIHIGEGVKLVSEL
jgi:hypothetical protein